MSVLLLYTLDLCESLLLNCDCRQERLRWATGKVLRVLIMLLINILSTFGGFMLLPWFGFGNSHLLVTSLSLAVLWQLGTFQGIISHYKQYHGVYMWA